MSKDKKIVKKALKHPKMFAPAELSFFEFWLKKRKEAKDARKKEEKDS